MRKKLAIINSLLIILAVGVITLLGFFFGRNTIEGQARHSLEELLATYSEDASYIYQSNLQGPQENSSEGDPTINYEVTSPDVRLVYVNSSRIVFYDSKSLATIGSEDWSNKEEIINADNGNESIITSNDQNGANILSSARKVSFAIRRGTPEQQEETTISIYVYVALTVDSINGFIGRTIPVYIGVGLILVAICIAVSIYFSRQALKPLKVVEGSLQSIAGGNYQPPDSTDLDKESKLIVDHLSQIAASLSITLQSLEEETTTRNLILENISDGLIVFAKDGTIILFNKRAKQIFGVEEEIIGQNLSVLVNKQFYEENISTEKALFDYEHEGHIYLCSLTSTEDMGLLVLTDVTTQRQAANQRRDFFDSASHELKTPLTSIQGFSELISLASEDEKVKKYCQVITDESNRMMSLVKDMLTLSMLEKKEVGQYEPISLKTIALEVKESLVTLIDQKDVTVSFSGDAKVRMDPKDATTLLKNLLENAIKYNKANGNVALRIDKKGFTVTDTGIGIPAKDLPYIYDRFYRVDKSRSKENGGTGLGLSIVKHLCNNYGFAIECESKIGIGTKFTITFAGSAIEKE